MTDALLAAAPATIKGVANLLQRSAPLIIEYGTERACDAVVALSEVNRHRLKRVIVEHQKNRLSGTNTGKLQQELFDTFADWNRDWRRIAVTEAGEMANQGIIAGLKPGARVKRIEQYHGACAFCKKIDGRVMNVVSPDDPNKNGDTDIWVGKTNVGRSQSPNKIVDGKLVPRGPDELWHIAAGTQHPHCRGRWEPLAEPQPGDDPAFAAWLDKTLTEALA